MQFGYINSFLADPRGTLIFLLLAFPGRMLAISAHEAAHAWMADRCGDPSARLMGRMTLNPFAHLDPVGLIMMVVLGIGWAKPVPVNPLNYRNYRRDDLKVSLAGVATNMALFLAGCILMYAFMGCALHALPYVENYWLTSENAFRTTYNGVPALINNNTWCALSDFTRYGIYSTNFAELAILPAFGQTMFYLYEMLSYFTICNLVLAIFNLIPLPPLDGYHVLNDLCLKRPLFADPRAQRIGQMILIVAAVSGVLSQALGWVYTGILEQLGRSAAAIFQRMGLF